jgi:hypothetical protein
MLALFLESTGNAILYSGFSEDAAFPPTVSAKVKRTAVNRQFILTSGTPCLYGVLVFAPCGLDVPEETGHDLPVVL